MKQILLNHGKTTIVDDEDYEKLIKHKWSYSSKGYVYRKATIKLPDGKSIAKGVYMHRFLLNFPENMFVDHIDKDPLNNQKFNLRVSTNADNQKNVGKRSSNTSGFKGVSFHKHTSKWAAEIQFNKQRMFLGVFSVKEEAAKAYDNAALLYHGEFANLNFPVNQIS